MDVSARLVQDVFSDIDDDYKYLHELQSLYDKGIIKWSLNWKFEPDSFIERSDFIWVVVESSCKKCIQPTPSPEFVGLYGDREPFFDVSTNDKNFYCISYAKDELIVLWYEPGTQCLNWDVKQWERPFCPDNYVTREEALAVLLRNSSIFSVEENMIIKAQIDTGKITEPLADDVWPKEDWVTNTFYWYFKKALEYSHNESRVDDEWNIISHNYKLVETVDWKLFPDRRITKEEYLSMAYIIFRANNCNFDAADDDFALSITPYDKSCTEGDSFCATSDLKWDVIYDFDATIDEFAEWEYECNWNFSYLWWPSMDYIWYIPWNYIDDYFFWDRYWDILEWKWRVTVVCEDEKNNASTSYVELNIVWEKEEEEPDDPDPVVNPQPTPNQEPIPDVTPLWISSSVSPNSGYAPLSVRMKWITEDTGYSYEWNYDWKTSYSKNVDYVFTSPWSYPVEFSAIKPNWESYSSKSVVTVYSEASEIYSLASKIEIYDKDCVKWWTCSPVDTNGWDTVYDIRWFLYWSNYQIPDSSYIWTLDYLWEVPGQYVWTFVWTYIDNYTFKNNSWELLEWEWKITLRGLDTYWNTTKSEATVFISEDIEPLRTCYIKANPIFWPYNLDVAFEAEWCISWDDVIWDFWDWTSWEWIVTEHVYTEPWIYEVVMEATVDWSVVIWKVVIKVELQPEPEQQEEAITPIIPVIPEPEPVDEPSQSFTILYSLWDWNICNDYFYIWLNSQDWGQSYLWDMWNWTTVNSREALYRYSTPWEYEITLKVTRYDWSVYEVSETVKVWNFESLQTLQDEINACFAIDIEPDNWYDFDLWSNGWNLYICEEWFTVNFETTEGWTQYYWDMWDWSAPINGREVNYSYTTPWNFTVTLNVVDEDWNIHVVTDTIQVWNFESEYELNQIIEECQWITPQPPIDTDGDWIIDDEDACPVVPWEPRNQGCPVVLPACDLSLNCAWDLVCNWSVNNCDTDADNDGIADAEDHCRLIPWVPERNWCPIFPSTNEERRKFTCAYPDTSSVIVWESVCNSCPCSNKAEYISTFRECDVIFWTILWPDEEEVFSKWNNYLIESE